MKNYYKILQVEVDATDSEIEEAYQKQLLKSLPSNHFIDFDPDKISFEDIQESYDVLSNTRKRMAYDRQLRAGMSRTQPSSEEGNQFGPVLEAMLSGGGVVNLKNNFGFPVVVVVLLTGMAVAIFYANSHKKMMVHSPQSEHVMASETDQALLADDPVVLESNLDAVEKSPEEVQKKTLKTHFRLISDASKTYKEREVAIQNILPLFESENSHVVVIGLNETPVRRQTIHDYLYFLLINGHKVDVRSLQQNDQGKITQLKLSEHYNDGL